MSRVAVLSLLMAAVSAGLLWMAPSQAEWLATAAKIGLTLSGLSLAVALLVGKRVKFDPILR